MRSALHLTPTAHKPDVLNDGVLTIEGRRPFCGRRAETLARLGFEEFAGKIDAASVVAGVTSEKIERDGILTKEELKVLGKTVEVPKTVAALLQRPSPVAVKLAPAERVVTTQVRAHYNPECIRLEELNPGYRAIAEGVLASLDRKEMQEHGYSRGGYSSEGVITSHYLLEYLSLDAQALAALTPKEGLPSKVLRRQAEALLRHITLATFDKETRSYPSAVTSFPVSEAKVRLVTSVRPDVSGLGPGQYHYPSRRLEVSVPEGLTVVLNAQCAAGGTVELSEMVLGHRGSTTPYQLPDLPGLGSGQPAELWITVLRGDEVLSNQVFQVPANPIVERSRQVRIPI